MVQTEARADGQSDVKMQRSAEIIAVHGHEMGRPQGQAADHDRAQRLGLAPAMRTLTRIGQQLERDRHADGTDQRGQGGPAPVVMRGEILDDCLHSTPCPTKRDRKR